MVNRLEIDNLCLRRGKNFSSSFTLQVEAGELVVLLGESGSGKSTLLRGIAGLLPPQSGTVKLNGKDITKLPPHRREMALVGEADGLFSHLRVAENVAFALGKYRPDLSQLEQVEVALSTLDLDHLRKYYPNQLSLGQRQKVALARVMVRRPEVLLLDEPLSHVDPQTRAQMRQIILRLHQRLGCGTIYVTHDLAEAYSLADRIVIIRDGKIIQDDFPEDLHDFPVDIETAKYLGASIFLPVTCQLEIDRLGNIYALAEVLGQTVRASASPAYQKYLSPDLQLDKTKLLSGVLVGYPGAARLKPLSERKYLSGNIGQIITRNFLGEQVEYVVETEKGIIKIQSTYPSAHEYIRGDLVQVELVDNQLFCLPNC